MKNQKSKSVKSFKQLTRFKRPVPKHAHLTEENATRGGEAAFLARIFFSSNPYPENPCRSAWIRGFKRAERNFNEGLRRSARIQETIALEEVEA